MSETAVQEVCECPPPAQRVAEERSDPRAELLRVAAGLARQYSDRLLAEYLRLRRSVR